MPKKPGVSKTETGGTGFVAALQVLVLAGCVFSCVFHHISVKTGLKFYLFQLAVLLSGTAVGQWSGVGQNGTAGKAAFGYGYGISLLLAEYFLLVPFGLKAAMPLCFCIVTIGSCIYLFRKRKHVFGRITVLGVYLLLLIAAVFVLDFIVVSMKNLLPGELESNAYTADFLFWIENSISCAKGYPAQTLRLSGYQLRYHFFSSIIMAQANLITGIDIRQICMYFSFFLSAPFLVLSGFCLFSGRLKEKILIAAGLLLFLFSDGDYVTYPSHIFTNPFGFDYGYAFSILAVCVLFEILEEKQFCTSPAVVSAVFIFMATGSKGPVALVALMAFGIAGIWYLIQRRWKEAFIYGIFWLGAFLLAYYLFISSLYTYDTVGQFGLTAVRESWGINNWVKRLELPASAPRALVYLTAAAAYVVCANVYASGLFAVGLLGMAYSRVKEHKVGIGEICLFGTGLWGMLLSVLINQDGNSQMYFIMAAFPFCFVLGLRTVEKIIMCRSTAVRLLLTFLLLLPLLRFNVLNSEYMKRDIRAARKRGIERESVYKGYCCDIPAAEAFAWIRENTEENTVIAMDDYRNRDGGTYDLITGAFAERYCYNETKYSGNEKLAAERTETVREYLAESSGEAEKILKEKGVQYILHNRRSEQETPVTGGRKPVFSNEAFDVYEAGAE